MKKLSTGEDSTLGNYRRLAAICFGVSSNAVEFLNKKISETPLGEMEEVLADESQMILLLQSMG